MELLFLFSIIFPWFYEIDLLKNLETFTEKHLCWYLLLNKVAGWRPTALLKKEPSTGVFL